MVGVIKPESLPTAAAILTSADPSKTWHDYEQSGGKLKLDVPATIPPAQLQILSTNQKLMDSLGANATPAIYYLNSDNLNSDNMLQQVVGLPDTENLNAMMGEK